MEIRLLQLEDGEKMLRDYWQMRAEERRWMIQSRKSHNLPSELAELAFCEQCHADMDYAVEGEARDYETNSGGYGYASTCCGEDVYAYRFMLALSPGRTRYIYPDAARLEYDGAEDDWDCYDRY